MFCFKRESTKEAIYGQKGDGKISVMNGAFAIKNKFHLDIKRQRKKIAHTQFITP